MVFRPRSRNPRHQAHHTRLTLEWLEDRTALSGSPLDMAVPLNFNAFNAAQVSHFLANPNEIDLYGVTLQRGDTLDTSIRAQRAGDGLVSLLRIFDGHGTP